MNHNFQVNKAYECFIIEVVRTYCVYPNFPHATSTSYYTKCLKKLSAKTKLDTSIIENFKRI